MKAAKILCLLFFIGTSYCSTIDKIVDIGHALSPDHPVYPYEDTEPFKLEVIYRDFLENGWFALNKYIYTTFAGTSFEAPFISFETGWKVDEVPQEHLFAEVSVIDISAKTIKDPNYQLTEEDVNDWISLNGAFPNNSVILVRTGWDARYGDAKSYFGVPPNLTFPSIGEDAGRRIINLARDNNLNFYGVGIDTAHIDKYTDSFAVHQLLASENMYVLHNLKDLHLVPHTGARILVAPMNVQGASGVPTRVIVQLPPSSQSTQPPSQPPKTSY